MGETPGTTSGGISAGPGMMADKAPPGDTVLSPPEFRSMGERMASPGPSLPRARPVHRCWKMHNPEEYERSLRQLKFIGAAAFTTASAETPEPAAGGEPDDTAPAGARVEDGGFEADPELERALETGMMGEDTLVPADVPPDPAPLTDETTHDDVTTGESGASWEQLHVKKASPLKGVDRAELSPIFGGAPGSRPGQNP